MHSGEWHTYVAVGVRKDLREIGRASKRVGRLQQGAVDVAKSLLALGTNVNAEDGDPKTTLHLALKDKKIALADQGRRRCPRAGSERLHAFSGTASPVAHRRWSRSQPHATR
jgi:hypothetical protein